MTLGDIFYAKDAFVMVARGMDVVVALVPSLVAINGIAINEISVSDITIKYKSLQMA